MSKIRCVLIDDELPGLTYLKMLCEQIPDLEIVKVYNQPEKFLKEIEELDIDLCITDIQMPVIDGISLVNLIQDVHFIFTTAYKEFAADAYELDVVDYITKPIKKQRLEKSVEKVAQLMERRQAASSEPFIQVNTDKGKMILFFDVILFIRVSDSDSRDKIVFLKDGTQTVLKNISFVKLLQLLPSDLFVRINKKEILAVKTIAYYTQNIITTSIIENEQALEFTLSSKFVTSLKDLK